MKALIILFLCFGFLADVNAQQLGDVTLIQGYGDDAVSVAHSDHGILFAGRYGGTGVVVGGDTLYPSNGLGDMFIGLMNESLSEILWIRSIGGYNAPGVFEDCSIVAISNDGFYISGTFGGPFSVDAHQAVVRGGQDAFLAKFDYRRWKRRASSSICASRAISPSPLSNSAATTVSFSPTFLPISSANRS